MPHASDIVRRANAKFTEILASGLPRSIGRHGTRTIENQKVDAGLARRYLATSLGNRTLKEAKLIPYVLDIRENRWGITGQSIIFDKQGHLLTGHHRLLSLLLVAEDFPDVSITQDIRFGIDRSELKNIDTGISWSLSDFFRSEGVKAPQSTERIVRAIMHYEETGEYMTDRGSPRSRDVTLEYYYKNKDTVDEIAGVLSALGRVPVSGDRLGKRDPIITVFYLLAARYSSVPGEVLEYLKDVFSDLGHYDKTDAAFVIHRKLREAMGTGNAASVSPQVYAYWLQRGWDAWQHSEPIEKARLPKGELSLVPNIT